MMATLLCPSIIAAEKMFCLFFPQVSNKISALGARAGNPKKMGFAPEILITVHVLLPCSRTTTPGTTPHEPTATSLHLAQHPPPPSATTVTASNFSLSLAATNSSPAALQFLSHQHRPNMFAPPPALPPPPPLTSSTLPVPGHPSGAAFSGKHSNLQPSHHPTYSE